MRWEGTGGALTSRLGDTAFTLSNGKRTLLVDCGSTVYQKLNEEDRLGSITDLVLTHSHSDHIGGVERFSFHHHYVLRRDKKVVLHLASKDFAHDLWEHSLKGGMRYNQEGGRPIDPVLETYFRLSIGEKIRIHGFPEITFIPTQHTLRMENYGLVIGNAVYYSGDTVDMPKRTDVRLLFQDVQLFQSGPDVHADIHMPFQRLTRDLPASVKRKMYLVHLGRNWENFDPAAEGFAGYVIPGQRFKLE